MIQSLSLLLLIPVLVVIALVCSIIFCVFYYSKKQTIIRTLKNTPRKPIGSLKLNQFTKITGKALHVKAPLIAPYSQRKCIYYNIKIQQKKSNGKNSYWKTLVNEDCIQDFFIDNNGDFVIVKPTISPKNYKSFLVIDKKVASGNFKDATPEFLALLNTYNIESSGLFGFNKQLRYLEGIIEIGEEITVAGISKWKTLKTTIPEYPYSKIAAFESTAEQKLIITDLPLKTVKK